MENSPLFSIVIPTYNRSALIAKTLSSIVDQTFNDYEIIVVDDGGSDNTKEVIYSLNIENLKYYYINNSERGAARNFGCKVAKGRFINFFDSDDLMYDNHLAVAAEAINGNENCNVFHLGYDIKSQDGKLIKVCNNLPENVKENLIYGNYLSCNGVFIRKDIALENPFIENRKLAASEDWELWLRLAVKYDFLIVNTVTSTIINHAARSVLNFDKKKLIESKYFFIDCVFNNELLLKQYARYKSMFIADAFLYISLHLALSKKYRIETLKYLFKGIIKYPKILFRRRTLAIIKHLI